MKTRQAWISTMGMLPIGEPGITMHKLGEVHACGLAVTRALKRNRGQRTVRENPKAFNVVHIHSGYKLNSGWGLRFRTQARRFIGILAALPVDWTDDLDAVQAQMTALAKEAGLSPCNHLDGLKKQAKAHKGKEAS